MSYDPEMCPKCKGKYDPYYDKKCPTCGMSVDKIQRQQFRIAVGLSSSFFDKEIAKLKKQGIVK